VSTIPLVTDDQARSVISAADALHVVEETYADLGANRITLSDPEVIRLSGTGGGFALKGAMLDRYGVAGVRLLPTHTGNGWCLVLETASGRPLVAVAETWLHRLRTAASAVVAARLLAGADARVLTLVGAGRIARLVPEAFAAAFDLRELRVTSRTPESAAALAARVDLPGVTAKPYPTVDEAAQDAEVLIAITSATAPVVHARHLRPGMTVIGLGGGPELAAGVTDVADRCYVDQMGYAREIGSVAGWTRAGVHVEDRLTGDLPAVVNGRVPGRTAEDETIVAVVQGVAACDVALACLVTRRLGVRS
jgi:alanine dehydrogenase